MNEKELLQAISQMMDEKLTPINDRLEKIEEGILKIEATLENETNKNIQLLIEEQSLNAEKLHKIDEALDDFDSSIIAMEAMTVRNIKDIKSLKRKAQ